MILKVVSLPGDRLLGFSLGVFFDILGSNKYKRRGKKEPGKK